MPVFIEKRPKHILHVLCQEDIPSCITVCTKCCCIIKIYRYNITHTKVEILTFILNQQEMSLLWKPQTSFSSHSCDCYHSNYMTVLSPYADTHSWKWFMTRFKRVIIRFPLIPTNELSYTKYFHYQAAPSLILWLYSPLRNSGSFGIAIPNPCSIHCQFS